MLLWVQGRRLKSSLLSLRRPPCLSSHLQPRGLNRLAPAISSPPPALAQWNTFARTVPASLPVAFAMDWWTTGAFADSNFASRVAKSDPNHFRIPVLRAGQSLPVKSKLAAFSADTNVQTAARVRAQSGAPNSPKPSHQKSERNSLLPSLCPGQTSLLNRMKNIKVLAGNSTVPSTEKPSHKTPFESGKYPGTA